MLKKNIVFLLLLFPILVLAQEPAKEIIPNSGTWLSVLPPLLAILIALIFRNVIPALFVGIVAGAWIAYDFGFINLFKATGDTLQIYVVDSLANKDNASVMLFSLMIGGMVGITSKNGGVLGVVNIIVKWANNVRKASLATVGMGMAIFFDDYANTLIVGNTMRPITDKLRISREKLAYFVDSTAAPIACIALVTTWIGFEVGLIDKAVAGVEGIEQNAYELFLNTIPYSFYPILALVLTITIAYSGRDFGPMLKAERRARNTYLDPIIVEKDENLEEEIKPIENKPRRAINAILPIVTMIVTVMLGLYFSGRDPNLNQTLKEIMLSENASPFTALLWGSLAGVLVAAILSMIQGILSIHETVDAWLKGVRSMLAAMIILLLAWSLSSVTEILETSQYLSNLLDGKIAPQWVPAIIFLISAATAFATGSSWGAMGILIPLFVPLTWTIMQSAGIADAEHIYILYVAISSILAGAVWGDHCSPISDTTILSSMACSCDHVEHVRTQIPYAIYAGGFAVLLGIIPVSFGAPVWLCLLLSSTLMIVGVQLIGKKVDE